MAVGKKIRSAVYTYIYTRSPGVPRINILLYSPETVSNNEKKKKKKHKKTIYKISRSDITHSGAYG